MGSSSPPPQQPDPPPPPVRSTGADKAQNAGDAKREERKRYDFQRTISRAAAGQPLGGNRNRRQTLG